MKANPRRYDAALKLIVAPVFLAVAIYNTSAQISASDPSLRLWLKSDNVSAADLSGTGITNWTDSSSYGTILVPPPLPPGDTGNDPSNHMPQFITVTNNGDVFPAVHFRQAYDPVVPDPTAGHLADRLWQTNNLGADDPTLIPPSSNITMIVVYRNDAPNAMLGPGQAIFCKRGPSACPYEFGLNVSQAISTLSPGPNHDFLTYAGSVAYSPEAPIPSQPEWGIVEMSITSGGTMTVKDYYRSLGGWRTSSMQGVARGGYAVGTPFTIGFHVQGAGGSASNPWGNGAYERFTGDIAEFALYNRLLSSNELAGVENSLLEKYFLQPGPPVITTQPQSQQVNEFDPVSFKVLPDGTPPFSYQWLKGGSPISGATASSYTIVSATSADAGLYSVVVSNSVGHVTSQAANLTVIADTNPPTVSSALLDYVDNTKVTVRFSELVDPASATNAANYSINNGVSVTSVAVGETNNTYWSNYIASVVLTTSPISSQSTLTVNGVQDRAGNAAANAQATILVPGAVSAPPATNRLLWLSADTGLLADNVGVYEWDDQSGATNEHNALYSFGNAEPGQAAFPNGIHPVVSFDGTAGLVVDNPADFSLQNFTIYVVGDVDNSKVSMNFLGNWEGWTLGISDGAAGVVKWVSYAPGGAVDSMEPAASHLGNRVPALIRGAFAYPGNKDLAVNGVVLDAHTNTAPIDYTTARGPTVGALFPTGAQNLVGDIAEVLVYSHVSAAQDAAVESYLAAKYFSPSTVLPELVSARLNPTDNTSVTVAFSEPVSASTAAEVANYSIDQGVTVSNVTVLNGTTVTLTTSPINAGATYTLTVNGVSDWAGNAITANSQVAVSGIPAPQLNIGMQGGSVSISWSAGTAYKLQSAPEINGPWTDVAGASSPYVVTPGAGRQFYRLSQ